MEGSLLSLYRIAFVIKDCSGLLVASLSPKLRYLSQLQPQLGYLSLGT